MDDELRGADVAWLRAAYRSGELSPVEVVRQTLDLLDETEPTLGAFVTVARAEALAAAQLAERAIRAEGDAAWAGRPLLGVPVSVKDLTPTKGIRTTRGSRLHADWVPGEDAPAVGRLRGAGAVVFGKTTTSEFGWSGSSGSPLWPATRNPWCPARSAGGSSGGAAAAVAAGVGVAATGTDGAGSVRIPAAFCGVVGLKPSFGRIPYLPASVELLSHVGPLTRTVADADLLARVMAGPDPRDPWSLDGPFPQFPGQFPGRRDGSAAGRRPVRVGWVPSLGEPAPDPEVERVARAAVDALGAAGYVVEEAAAPFADPYPVLAVLLASAEAAGHTTEAARRAGELDQDRLAIAEHGRRLTAVDVVRAQQARAQLWRQAHRWTADYDLLATPTVPVPPFGAGSLQPPEPVVKDDVGGALSWLAWTPATYPFNLTGQPAISVPAGVTGEGLPVGLQLVGGWRADDVVLAAAAALERARPWQRTAPDRGGDGGAGGEPERNGSS